MSHEVASPGLSSFFILHSSFCLLPSPLGGFDPPQSNSEDTKTRRLKTRRCLPFHQSRRFPSSFFVSSRLCCSHSISETRFWYSTTYDISNLALPAPLGPVPSRHSPGTGPAQARRVPDVDCDYLTPPFNASALGAPEGKCLSVATQKGGRRGCRRSRACPWAESNAPAPSLATGACAGFSFPEARSGRTASAERQWEGCWSTSRPCR